jgi:hypothetical protein
MTAKYSFIFSQGFNKVEEAVMTFDKMRPKAFALAGKTGKPVNVRVCNERMRRWEPAGDYYPDGKTVVDRYGEVCEYDEKLNFLHIKK